MFLEDNLIQFTLGFKENFDVLGFLGVILLFPGLLFLVPSILIEFYYPKSFGSDFQGKIAILSRHFGLIFIYVTLCLLISSFALSIFVNLVFPGYLKILPEIEYSVYLVIPQAFATPFYIYLLSINYHKKLLLVIISILIIFCFDIVANNMYEFLTMFEFINRKIIFKSLYLFLLLCLTLFSIKNESNKKNHAV